MYPRRKKFFSPLKRVFFSRSGTTADGSRQPHRCHRKNRQHSGKRQLREVTASLGPFTAAAAQKQERCAEQQQTAAGSSSTKSGKMRADAAEQQQTAAVEAQLQLIRKYVYPGLASGMRFSSGKAAAAQRGRWRRGAAATATAARARGNEINAAAAARARGNEINTDRRSNALLTCQFPVF